jgi:hypothetical protein
MLNVERVERSMQRSESVERKVLKKVLNLSNKTLSIGARTLRVKYGRGEKMKKYVVVFSALTAFLLAISMCASVHALTGDVNHDGKVDILDLALVAKAFGSKPGDPNWNPDADVYPDGLIDIRDMAIVAKNFGKTG